MNTTTTTKGAATCAVDAPTQFAHVRGRTIAYRSIGEGTPLILCLRLRGVLDSWDPAFLDALAANFRVITFDYSGLGQSTGTPSYRRTALADDARDLADALGLERVVIGGWSLGGLAAQVFAARHADRTSHAIIIGSGPPGVQPHAHEPLFLQTATKANYTLEDEYILFFEPASERSRRAAKRSHDRIAQRRADRSPPIPEATYMKLLGESAGDNAIFVDDGDYDRTLSTSPIPILALCGDHDIMFPVENWYALNRRWRSLQIMTLPQAGHGPQHEQPQMCADAIASFVRHTSRG